MQFALAPQLTFVRDGESAPAGMYAGVINTILEHSLFVYGVTRSGKTNLIRYFVECIFGLAQIVIVDPEADYVALRSADRPFLIVGKGRDVELALVYAEDARKRTVLDQRASETVITSLMERILERRLSVVLDISEYDEPEQQLIVATVCDVLVSLPQTREGDIVVVIDELQEFAREGAGRHTARVSVERLAKRGLKRGVSLIGGSPRIADVANSVITSLKNKVVGGTDDIDVPRALEQLGMPRRNRGALADLEQGEFWVKGPAFSRHAVHVRAPLAQTSPPKRRRGEGAVVAENAPAEIAAVASDIAADMARLAIERAPRAEDGSSPGAPDPAEDTTALVHAESATDAVPAIAAGAGDVTDAVRRERARQEGKRLVLSGAVSDVRAKLEIVDRAVSAIGEYAGLQAARVRQVISLLDGVAEEADASVTTAHDDVSSQTDDVEQRIAERVRQLIEPPRVESFAEFSTSLLESVKVAIERMPVDDDDDESAREAAARLTVRVLPEPTPMPKKRRSA